MKRLGVLLSLIVAHAAFAAPEFEIGGRYITTVIREETTFDGGSLEIPSSLGFGASAEVFWTPSISTQLTSTFVQPEAILFPSSGGDTDLGTLGINLTNLMMRLHMRTGARFSPVVAAGLSLVTPGDLDDRFGTAIKADVKQRQTFAVEAGARFRVSRSVWLEGLVSYVPLELDVEFDERLPRTLKLDPLIVGIAVARRF